MPYIALIRGKNIGTAIRAAMKDLRESPRLKIDLALTGWESLGGSAPQPRRDVSGGSGWAAPCIQFRPAHVCQIFLPTNKGFGR
jgi:hypothetical protein